MKGQMTKTCRKIKSADHPPRACIEKEFTILLMSSDRPIPGLYMIGYGTGKIILKLVITALLNFERGTSRAGNSNENKNTNKHISVAPKCDITLNFPVLDIPRSIGRKAGISK